MNPTVNHLWCLLMLILLYTCTAEFECQHGVRLQDSYRKHQIMNDDFQIQCKLWLEINTGLLGVKQFDETKVCRKQLRPPKETLEIANQIASDCVSKFLKQSVSAVGRLIMFRFSKNVVFTVYCVKDIEEQICTQPPLDWSTNKSIRKFYNMEHLELLPNLMWQIDQKPVRENIRCFDTDEPLTKEQWNLLVATKNITMQCPVERYGSEMFDLQIQQGCTIKQLLQQIYDVYQLKVPTITEKGIEWLPNVDKMGGLIYFEGISQSSDGTYNLNLGS